MLLAALPVQAQTTVDYDADDDRLIEIDTPAKLNAIRYDPDGDGAVSVGDQTSYDGGFANAAASQCPNPGCQGYELTADLDLAAAYPSWTPIANFYAIFDGNGHTIAGLNVSTGSGDAGLFGELNTPGVIRYVGLLSPAVASFGVSQFAGALAGELLAGSNIYASYVAGGSVFVNGASALAGGLAGLNDGGRIQASYATASVGGAGNPDNIRIGGLVGQSTGGAIIASYAAGPVSPGSGVGAEAGGLVGRSANSGAAITNSYCDTAAALLSACIGATTAGSTAAAPGYGTRQLQAPTAYAGLYRQWNLDLDGDGRGDRPWDFGSPRHYPALQADRDGDGRATCREFGGQRCYIPPGPPPYNPAHDHPEIYTNARYAMATSCAVRTTGTGDAAVSTSTLTFNLGRYTRPLTLVLSLWDGTHFRTLQSQGIAMPELRQEGRMATVEVATDPAQTRFRLDSEYGLNLVLGYADCHTDDP